ncbi:uncharacterized protein SPSK_02475 [Sporothrix schenckii 1099-18]|uniref:PLD phosphodiesterase domain-containing protein n=1 Tax=Sporothrix schenckii 1099-18 TaxID=1397361 RepID=A0A0F2M9I4_SPOSC|nr:uncharacterized protein SPSK_02475 [Sporothrix schenckii 1099-18]KJR86373.1 hypothetical protein SPSK_02475 [Sporothrix schenckii 1099-18]
MGHMHSKLQLLKFPGHLRIAVPTGNLVPYDWGETGTLENMVFLIDLPKLPKGRSAEGTGTPFMENLSYFLTAQGVDAAMVQSLRSYDFSETVRYAFVHSISGSHMDESWKRTGYSGLGRAVKAMGWASTDPIQVDYICSSVGSVSDDLLNALYFACQGDSGLKELESRTKRPRGGKGKSVAAPEAAPANPNSPQNCLRLYFPSDETVGSSIGGKNKKWWEAPSFPKAILRDVQNVRTGVLMHTKLLFVRLGYNTQESEASDAARPRGWAYVGSANMSESAW